MVVPKGGLGGGKIVSSGDSGRCVWAARVVADLLLLSAPSLPLPWGCGQIVSLQILSLLPLWRQRESWV